MKAFLTIDESFRDAKYQTSGRWHAINEKGSVIARGCSSVVLAERLRRRGYVVVNVIVEDAREEKKRGSAAA